MSGPAHMHRFRVGTYSLFSAAWTIFLVAMGVLFVAISASSGGLALTILGAGMALLGLWTLPWCLDGLAAVRVVPGENGTISVPGWSWRRGFRRTVWPLCDVFVVELVPTRSFPVNRHYYVRLAERRDELRSDSITCSIRRRHPERSPAGRAVAQIKAFVDEAHGF